MGMDNVCNRGLILGLGFPPPPGTPSKFGEKSNLGPPNGFDIDPCLTLSLSGGTFYREAKERVFDTHRSSFNEESGGGRGQAASSQHSGASSFSCGKAVIKREREESSDDNEIERVSSKASDEDDDLGGGGNTLRKKLRLTKDQSALLEENFKQHIALNPKQKQALARQLNLRPRQVEVWFQNRRARTKLKQTEVDCDFLKKCCETLSDENRRLQKELQELKALKLAQPLYTHVGGAATLTMCPSCERVCGGVDDKSTKGPFSMAQATKPHFYAHPFTNPSATCRN